MDACGAGVAVLDNKLYVVGGSQGRTASSMCQVYGPASNSWSKVAELNTGE
jgi:N-acetylneuraminic acid mutarotase